MGWTLEERKTNAFEMYAHSANVYTKTEETINKIICREYKDLHSESNKWAYEWPTTTILMLSNLLDILHKELSIIGRAVDEFTDLQLLTEAEESKKLFNKYFLLLAKLTDFQSEAVGFMGYKYGGLN